MVRTAGATLGLLVLVLAVLPDCPRAADCPLLRGDDHSVYYDFNISSKKQPWCMAQVQMDGKDLFSYDCGSGKIISMNLLKEEVMATETWKEQTTKLCDVGKSIKDHLHDINPANHTGPFILQARMTCHCNASGNYNGSWAFGWNGQRVLLFDSDSGKYTVDQSGGEQMKEKWEKEDKLTKEFKITSKGDCKKWLPHLVLWKEELKTTGAPFTAPATATPSTVSAAPAKTTAKTIASIVFGVLVVPLLVLAVIFLPRFLRSNRRCCSETPEGVVSSCSPADLLELQSLQQMQRPPEDREDTADAISMSFIA